MILRRQVTVALLSSLVASLISLVTAQNPTHEITSFNNLPARLFFLKDSTAAIYHDVVEGAVYVSQDEGKSWAPADRVPAGEASMVIEHPFDMNYAFILTMGTTHYRTEDRGRTWSAFRMPARPALVAHPLSFHSDPTKYGYILYQATVCNKIGMGTVCHDETYYTKQAFMDTPMLLLSETSRCQFAHGSDDFKHDAHSDLIFCVAYKTSSNNGGHDLSSSLLYSSTDFFEADGKVEDLGIGQNARGVFFFAIVGKYAVVALRDFSTNNDGEMLLYVTIDTKTWAKAQFPHASSVRLKENGYTIVESTIHSLGVDVVLQGQRTIGTLFVSNSNGTFFVESLRDTNRNAMGFVDFEKISGVDGVGLANIVANAEEVEGRGAQKILRSLITFDDGSSWSLIKAPLVDVNGDRVGCDPGHDGCSLHLHSVTEPHNFGPIFSSPVPGFVMGVGSIGKTLLPYEDCDTFLSTDAGLNWKMAHRGAYKYEFGDSGDIILAVNDEDGVDNVVYSLDMGESWQKYDLPVKFHARALTTVPDSASQKFILVGQVSRENQGRYGRYIVIFLDFAGIRTRQCSAEDMELWNARGGYSECLMGHKQWYSRRKSSADCYLGDTFIGHISQQDNCECTDADYECDFNFIRAGNECISTGPEPIPAGVCRFPSQLFEVSSGYRKIPGNTCTGGSKDNKVLKSCENAEPEEGEVVHQTFKFPSEIAQYAYFRETTTILVRLYDGSMWQSINEGYTWNQIDPGESFVTFYHHPYSSDRAYLITRGSTFYVTTDCGRTWHQRTAPASPNTFGAAVIRFQPQTDNLIWTGSVDCGLGTFGDCHAEAFYSRDNGRNWKAIEKYVVNCAWAMDVKLNADPTEILCESYQNKAGDQRFFQHNPLQLIEGQGYYAQKKLLFNSVVGFAKFSEFLIVAELAPSGRALEILVSLDGVHFATAMFPPTMHPETHAYTVLHSSTGSMFIHMTMSQSPSPSWGTILKSNSNGTYFIVSQEYVNRDDRGYVDFEKMNGLDGIALINIVSNPIEAILSGQKKLQSRITHNDGSTWKPLQPPVIDSQGNEYPCSSTACSLHVHGYTDRPDPRATYSSPSIVGVIMAVGNVGESLAHYTESDTFLSRDGGFTWEEVQKGAHLWEFGDAGGILIMANDQSPTDYVLFSTNGGLDWQEYKFTEEKIRVKSINTVSSYTSRRFILIGQYHSQQSHSVAVHIDFTALTSRRCSLNAEDQAHSDFELWSPSENRTQRCLFGRQTLYPRRLRDADCVVGNQHKGYPVILNNCACISDDFECEFNYIKNTNGECVLALGTSPLPNDEICRNGEDDWHERTAYRKISYSTCDGEFRPDRGTPHSCSQVQPRTTSFWWFGLVILLVLALLPVGLYCYRRYTRGQIRLPPDEDLLEDL